MNEVKLYHHGDSPITLHAYKPYTGLRVIGAIVVIAALIIGGLAYTGHLSSPPDWLNAKLALWKPLVGSFAAMVLMAGSSIVILRAKQKLASGSLVGSNHWQKCIVSEKHPQLGYILHVDSHIDISTLDHELTGTARLYTKTPSAGTQTGLYAALFMPLHLALVIIYNIGRLIIVPVYVVIQMARESQNNKPLYSDQGYFSWSDIPKQMALSIGRIIQAPFYALAFFFASLYAVIDPMNGVKLGAAIESDWNDDLPLRNSGYWMIAFKSFDHWAWEGGGGPKKLGQNGFFFAGSWQPFRELEFEKGILKRTTLVGGAPENHATNFVA